MQAPAPVISRLRPALGTFVAIEAEAIDLRIAQCAVEAAFDAIATVARVMHPRRAGSDLAALTAGLPGIPLRVHPWTWKVFELCQRLNQSSRGIFDPCLDAAGGRMRDLELLEPPRVLPHAALCIDLGGIAKGYAVDRAIDALRAAGCDGGLVNAGGDLAVFGARSHTILCAETHRAAAAVELRDAALATSDVAQPCRPSEHRGYYHGLDRTAVACGRVTVSAASAAVADALTKCLLFGDRALNQALLRAFDAKEIAHAIELGAT
jgi:FAD:protein FMN transferase